MSVTKQQATAAKDKICEQVMKAVKDYHNNPDKAEPYILQRIQTLFEFAVVYGRESGLDEIFNGEEC